MMNATKTGMQSNEDSISYSKAKPTPVSAEEQFRLMQAIELIQSFRETIVVDGQAVEVPVFVPSDSDPGAFVRNPLLSRQETAKDKECTGEDGGER